MTTGHAGSSRGLMAAAGLIAVTTLAARVVGFGRWLAFSHSVGAGCVGEAYSTANIIPNVLFEVAAGGALAAIAVPLVAGELGRGRREDADAAASALLTWSLAVLVPLSVVLALLAGPMVDLLYRGGGCAGGADLAASMLVVFAPQLPLYGVGIVLAGVLQAHRRFLAAALAPLLSSVVVIATYVAYGVLPGSAAGVASAEPSGATTLLAVGTTLGVATLSLSLVIPVARAGVRLRPGWRFPSGLGASARRLAIAGVLALMAQQLAVVVSFAVMHASAGPGTVNVYQYVQAVYLLPYAVLAVPVATAAFPALAAGTAANDDRTTVTLARSLRVVVVAGCLGVALLVATAAPVGWFFGALDAGRDDTAGLQALQAMAPALVSFAPGLLGFGVAALLTRALYVRGRPVSAAGFVAAGWVLAALLPIAVLSRADDEPGATVTLTALGSASSLGMTVAAVGLVVAVRHWWGEGALAGCGRTLGAGLVAAVAGGLLGAVVASWAVPDGSPGATGLTAALLGGLLAAVVALAAVVGVMAALDRSTLAALTGRLRRRVPVEAP